MVITTRNSTAQDPFVQPIATICLISLHQLFNEKGKHSFVKSFTVFQTLDWAVRPAWWVLPRLHAKKGPVLTLVLGCCHVKCFITWKQGSCICAFSHGPESPLTNTTGQFVFLSIKSSHECKYIRELPHLFRRAWMTGQPRFISESLDLGLCLSG